MFLQAFLMCFKANYCGREVNVTAAYVYVCATFKDEQLLFVSVLIERIVRKRVNIPFWQDTI